MKTFLFTSTTCGKCPDAKAFMKEKNIEHELINCDDNKENMELAHTYNIYSVPTIVLMDKNSFTTLSFQDFKEKHE